MLDLQVLTGVTAMWLHADWHFTNVLQGKHWLQLLLTSCFAYCSALRMEIRAVPLDYTASYLRMGNGAGYHIGRPQITPSLESSPHLPASRIHFGLLLLVVPTGSGAHPPYYPMGTGDSFPGVKWPGREADHWAPISAGVNKTWVCTSTTPYVFMA
jgi:hypothetical protein